MKLDGGTGEVLWSLHYASPGAENESTYAIDLDLRSYFDTVRHEVLLKGQARRFSHAKAPCHPPAPHWS